MNGQDESGPPNPSRDLGVQPLSACYGLDRLLRAFYPLHSVVRRLECALCGSSLRARLAKWAWSRREQARLVSGPAGPPPQTYAERAGLTCTLCAHPLRAAFERSVSTADPTQLNPHATPQPARVHSAAVVNMAGCRSRHLAVVLTGLVLVAASGAAAAPGGLARGVHACCMQRSPAARNSPCRGPCNPLTRPRCPHGLAPRPPRPRDAAWPRIAPPAGGHFLRDPRMQAQPD